MHWIILLFVFLSFLSICEAHCSEICIFICRKPLSSIKHFIVFLSVLLAHCCWNFHLHARKPFSFSLIALWLFVASKCIFCTLHNSNVCVWYLVVTIPVIFWKKAEVLGLWRGSAMIVVLFGRPTPINSLCTKFIGWHVLRNDNLLPFLLDTYN